MCQNLKFCPLFYLPFWIMQSILLHNFKSYENQSISSLNSRINVVLGSNGQGKSNFFKGTWTIISAISFLFTDRFTINRAEFNGTLYVMIWTNLREAPTLKNQKYWSKLILDRNPKKKNHTRLPNHGVTLPMKTSKSTTNQETKASFKISSRVLDSHIRVRTTLFNKEKFPKYPKWTKTKFTFFSKTQQELSDSWKRTKKLRIISPKFRLTSLKVNKISSFSKTKFPKLKTKRTSMNFSQWRKKSEKSRRKDNLLTILVMWKIT